MFAMVGCSTLVNPPRPRLGEQTHQQFRTEVRSVAELDYLLYVPRGASHEPSKKWPLVLFLHGAGERGSDLSKVAVHGPPKLAAAGGDLPFILVSPQCPVGKVWDAPLLIKLLDQIQRRLPVDSRRVYVTGLSMGGYGTWDLAMRYPERFAAVAPICGGGERIRSLLLSSSPREAIKGLKVRVYHGGKDTVVPLAESERMVEAFKKLGTVDIELTVYPEAGHDSWTRTYQNPEFFKWLLAQAR